VSQAIVQSRTKGFYHHNPKDRDSKYACYSRHCVVDSRSRADSVFIYRIHNDGGERSYSERHSESENNHRGEELPPIATSDRGHSEQSEAQCNDERTNDQRTPRAIAGNKSARPARKKEHKQDQGKDGSAGCCGGVSLDLDEVQGKQEKENPDSGI
jgi:hypothetical protein